MANIESGPPNRPYVAVLVHPQLAPVHAFHQPFPDGVEVARAVEWDGRLAQMMFVSTEAHRLYLWRMGWRDITAAWKAAQATAPAAASAPSGPDDDEAELLRRIEAAGAGRTRKGDIVPTEWTASRAAVALAALKSAGHVTTTGAGAGTEYRRA